MDHGNSRQAIVVELLLEDLNKFSTTLRSLIPLLELISFVLACIPANGTDIDHAISELNECTSHGW